ncbi:MAG TPA: hypothetical protein ENI89_07635 [Desulfobulbus sp.]|nr:hypothetical protein [Desulfobulbus sp.]
MPALAVFDLSGTPADILYRAMDMERGAQRWYEAVLARHPASPFAPAMRLLARAEEEHAHLVYRYWIREESEAPSFAEVYGSLAGAIVEGGTDVADMLARLEETAEDGCIEIVEMSLAIELAAYDLYRGMAHRFSGSDMEDPFLVIAQAEKEHMRLASESLQLCDQF